jgi:RNA exonuclease NGL2
LVNALRTSLLMNLGSSDFNFSPDEAAYSLLVGDPVLPVQEETLAMSRVVHASVESGAPLRVATKATEDSEYNPATDPDKVITNARPAVPEDGLLSTDELTALFSESGPVRSMYDEAQHVYQVTDATLPVLGDRVHFPPHRKGVHEPMWTSYTHYWKTVLGW